MMQTESSENKVKGKVAPVLFFKPSTMP